MIKSKNYKYVFFMMLVIFVVLFIMSIFLGVSDLTYKKIIDVFLGQGSEIDRTIIFSLRLPRAVMAVLTGMGLALSGLVFQTVFDNPMADPYILGVSSGAALGASIAITFFSLGRDLIGYGTINISAFLTAVLTVSLVYMISLKRKRTPMTLLLLSGIAINLFISSLISTIMIFNSNDIAKIIFWTMGSFTNTTWREVYTVSFFFIVSISIFLFSYKEFDIIQNGEESAKSLGLNTEKFKIKIFILSSLMIAGIVCFNGIIGFVGLIVPNFFKLIMPSKYKVLFPFVILGGGLFMLLADILAKTVAAPVELPVGIVCALIGVPYFIYMISKIKYF